MTFETIDSVQNLFEQERYVADRSLATAVFLAFKLNRPLFLEGEAGVGKTEVAQVLSRVLGRRAIRLQCYEGLDVSTAVYEWNYPRQMLEIRLSEAQKSPIEDLFSDRFLIRRPLLQALDDPHGTILLIDELDRADEPFEAYLLEILSDFQVTIPEFRTIQATIPPLVVITSNRTREIHDALKRRCLYVWIDYPDSSREKQILALKVPQASERLSTQVVAFVQRLRDLDLFKPPGVAETLDWAQALLALDRAELTPEVINDTLGVVLKYQDDILKVQGQQTARLLETIQAP